ncbi:AAA family ATPase [Nitrincola tapanii]|uniref:Pilus assembly protein n=1 Tax=Nitrincola tapanii TaxID=1708751 RepID=A0A5A9W0K8_9GAMM|nr:pilus assembly protein [Nitrincola tapanii]KAA0874093.1 pilus assembly protein [Nitrincola tapanii]
MEHTFIACTSNDSDVEWLQNALASLGQLVKCSDHIDEMTALVDVTEAHVVFIGLDPENIVSRCGLIESLLEVRPMLSIIAVGDGLDNQLVISSMRAGARDFITYGLRSSEVLALVRRLISKLPAISLHKRELGSVYTLYGSDASADSSLLATHLAVYLCQNPGDALLLDLALPMGCAYDYLGLQPTFNFEDALRNLRRMDISLIQSAVSQHKEKLYVLGLMHDSQALQRCSSAEVYLLLGVLRQHFKHIVINVCGQPDSEALMAMIARSDQLLWYADQSVSTCRRNLAQLEIWRERSLVPEKTGLVIDRYISSVAPDKKTLAESFGLPLAAVIPDQSVSRLRCKNAGQSMFDLMRGDSLSRSVIKLAHILTNQKGITQSSSTLIGKLKEWIG